MMSDRIVTHRGVADMTPAQCHCCLLRVTGNHQGCVCTCENPPPKKPVEPK